MIQVFRVVIPFDAQQLRQEPLRMERFGSGDLLIVLREEDPDIIFCRYNPSAALDARDEFAISELEFEQYTEEL